MVGRTGAQPFGITSTVGWPPLRLRSGQAVKPCLPLVLLEQKVKSLPNLAKKAESGSRTQPLPERGIILASKDDPALG